MNIAISKLSAQPAFQGVKYVSQEELSAARKNFFDTSKDSVDTLRKKVWYMENRFNSERDYYKSLAKEGLASDREAVWVKRTLDRMEFELKTLRREFVKLLKAKA